MNILSGLKDLAVSAHLVTDEDEPKPHSTEPQVSRTQQPYAYQPQVPSPVSAGTPPPLSSFVTISAPASSPEIESIYQEMVGMTDFEKTNVAVTLQKFLAPLANLPMDSGTKFRSAMAIAKAQSGITEQSVLDAFDTMKGTLSSFVEDMKNKGAEFVSKEVTARQNLLVDIQAQIASLTEKQGQVATELAAAQDKANRAHSAIEAASIRRSTEIDQQRTQYAALLASN